MTRGSALLWLERALVAAGACLGVWCLAILLEARYTNTLPPPVKVTMTLPPDAKVRSPRPPRPVAGALIGRLQAPTLHITTTVLEGSDDRTLSRASGHIEETPLPGEDGNVGIAGHRDTVFRPLKHAKPGDPLTLTTADHIYRYRITRTFIVDPQDVYVLDPTAAPTLTLVTCYPFEFIGHAPHRFIVKAELVGTEARKHSP
jgi:LPXTG-site transpeptidase (sortase) family protein